MKGLIVFAHGSPVPAANDAVRAVTDRIRQRSEYDIVEAAFLESAAPDLPQAVRDLAQSGARQIVVVPYFLTPGLHLTRDLPGIVAGLRGIYQSVTITVTDSLDGHPALLEAVLDRARQFHGGSGSEGQAG
jgi:sirohydrochlorin ferrochelatase